MLSHIEAFSNFGPGGSIYRSVSVRLLVVFISSISLQPSLPRAFNALARCRLKGKTHQMMHVHIASIIEEEVQTCITSICPTFCHSDSLTLRCLREIYSPSHVIGLSLKKGLLIGGRVALCGGSSTVASIYSSRLFPKSVIMTETIPITF